MCSVSSVSFMFVDFNLETACKYSRTNTNTSPSSETGQLDTQYIRMPPMYNVHRTSCTWTIFIVISYDHIRECFFVYKYQLREIVFVFCFSLLLFVFFFIIGIFFLCWQYEGKLTDTRKNERKKEKRQQLII